MFFHVLVCSALIHFLYIISVPLCCFFYLFILFFLAISCYFSSNFLFLFAKKKRKKIKEKCINFAKKIMFWLVLLSFIFFLYLLVPLCCSFSFFLRKAHLAGRSSTGELVIYVVFVFYLFFLLFHVIVSNFLFLFTKNNVKNKRTMHQFRKKKTCYGLFCSRSLFCFVFSSCPSLLFIFIFSSKKRTSQVELLLARSAGDLAGRSGGLLLARSPADLAGRSSTGEKVINLEATGSF